MNAKGFARLDLRVDASQVAEGISHTTVLERAFDPQNHLFQAIRVTLHHEILGSPLQGLARKGCLVGVGEQEHRSQLVVGFRGLQDVETVLRGQVEVSNDHLEEAPIEVLHGLTGVTGFRHLMSLLAEGIGESRA